MTCLPMARAWCVQVHISYLEIYNEVGYDLLDPTREVQAMEDLPQARQHTAGLWDESCTGLPCPLQTAVPFSWHSQH